MCFRNKHHFDHLGTHGLQWRIQDQIYGRDGPGTQGWTTHDTVVRQSIKGLNIRIKNFLKFGCDDDDDNDDGSKSSITPEMMAWASAVPPKPEEWKGPQVAEILGHPIHAADVNRAVNAAKSAGDGTVRFLGGLVNGTFKNGVFIVTALGAAGGAVLKFSWDAVNLVWKLGE